MWSSVEEKITDGTSGLSPNTEPAAVLIGTCSKGTVNVPVALGKGSKTEDVLGYGELPRRFAEMQANMSDVSVIAVPSDPDQPGTIGEVKQTGDKALTVSGATKCSAALNITVITAGASVSRRQRQHSLLCRLHWTRLWNYTTPSLSSSAKPQRRRTP